MHTSLGALIWVFGCSTIGCTSLGATDPLLKLPQCLSKSETITLQGSVLYLFNCKCPMLSKVPWVSLLQPLFPGWKYPHICKGIHWWGINGSPTHHGKDMVTASLLVFLIFLHRPLQPTVWTHLEFQFMTTVFMSMATRLSDLDDQKPGTNIQKESHTLTPWSSWNGPEDPDTFGNTPSQSPSQSQVRKPKHYEIWYCLKIQVISAKDKRAAVYKNTSVFWGIIEVTSSLSDGIWDIWD